MTEHRISPLQWLSTKFASLNHSHSDKEDVSNKTSSWNSTTNDNRYPTEKLVKDSLDLKSDDGHTHSQYLTSHQSLINYIQKSQTSGLVKNDGTIDSTSYLSSLPSHNHDDRYYTETEINTALNDKQDSLTSGTNIKTINNESILGSGNITVGGSSFSGSYADLTNKPAYTATVTSSTTGAYKIGSINISGSSVDIYGKDTDTAPPSASTTTPSADSNNGSYGSGDTYARANHQHPKSSIYAESTHTHTYTNISNVTPVDVVVTYTDNSTETIKLLKYTGT